MAKEKGQSGQQGGGGGSLIATCPAHGCKTSPKNFGFCKEHFGHYKFGLINKKGEKVLDYDKKIEHYLEHKEREGKRKVA